uniref:TTF-type domain-containing protein n=1 Tax=Lactuca sativa TaxID=4236 RepID=A0A9R1WDI3_LACSA|nr:hypothetical protein LSAT_V11C100004550 [Lactuca sativa]
MGEEIRCAYMTLGPFQIRLKKYHAKGSKKHPHRFQYSWFNIFPNWLEYSPTAHASYCFISFKFNDKPSVCHVKGFDNWKKVNDGKNGAFLKHIRYSQQRNNVAFAENLMNQESHIENIIVKQNEAQILKNRLRVKASIDTARWLTFQVCALRGHDESPNFQNCGNFLQLLKLLASYNDEVANRKLFIIETILLEKFKKKFLVLLQIKLESIFIVKWVIHTFVSWLMSRGMSLKKSKLRYFEIWIIRESFLDLVQVRVTLSLTLKTNMRRQLLHYQFDVSKICGQGYDGAMCASSKCHDELQKAKATKIEQLLELGEIESDLMIHVGVLIFVPFAVCLTCLIVVTPRFSGLLDELVALLVE